ncbi:glucosamine-6-phosphate deaminase [Marinococcus halophilus]|uniref:Glucosamine-6-phosphate deaminase n=1 Tax=Marinococcus halophilus TaxID=1371 RepID=A0A510Y7W2_MARHA|nr:glucosamine-6-phosphate deaminase [Marinococcus halophilus]OZT79598.1 glucosamine-6-phosphate deaminase [Marinococcus halophilus]GEK59468.1 glucosamine-6-phosphate deaminase [Marinococcus halophilus]
MHIHVLKNTSELAQYVAQQMYQHILERSTTRIGFATGETPKETYNCLVNYVKHAPLNLNGVETFNLDEYIDLSPAHPNSYHYYMDQYVFSPLKLSYDQTHIPRGNTNNSTYEAEHYEHLIKEHGPIHLQVLGLGINGHIGFNEPGTEFSSRTRVVELAPSTRQANSKHFASNEKVPTHAITMGLGTIMESEKIFLLVQGADKTPALHELLHSSPTQNFPASILHSHPNVHIFTTESTMYKL